MKVVDNETPVRWSSLGIIGSTVATVVVTMWTITGSMDTLVNKLEATDAKVSHRITLLEGNQITK